MRLTRYAQNFLEATTCQIYLLYQRGSSEGTRCENKFCRRQNAPEKIGTVRTFPSVDYPFGAGLTAETIFNVVEAGAGLVTYGLAIILFHLPRPRRHLVRGGLAVAASWVVGIAYTAFVYNPAAIAAARAAGVHFPEGHFDNNTIAVSLVAGWIGPAIILAIMGAFRAMREDVGLRSDERAPNTT